MHEAKRISARYIRVRFCNECPFARVPNICNHPVYGGKAFYRGTYAIPKWCPLDVEPDFNNILSQLIKDTRGLTIDWATLQKQIKEIEKSTNPPHKRRKA